MIKSTNYFVLRSIKGQQNVAYNQQARVKDFDTKNHVLQTQFGGARSVAKHLYIESMNGMCLKISCNGISSQQGNYVDHIKPKREPIPVRSK